MRWLIAQHAFQKDPAKIKLIRMGNQYGGKTTAALAEVDWRLTGRHPYLVTHKPPVRGWVVTATATQGIAIQEKFWSICDRSAIDWTKTQEFTEKTGFGRNPVIQYKNGSVLKFKSVQQDARTLASETLHFVMLDEPADERVYNELKKRLMKKNGTFILSTTPIGADLSYLRAEVEAGIVSDHHYPFRAELMIPVGSRYPMRLDDGLGTFMDKDFVNRIRSGTRSASSPIILDGEWDYLITDAMFVPFDKGRHTVTRYELAQDPTEWHIHLGIDHGERTFKQCASLVAIEKNLTANPAFRPRVLILDEWFGEGQSTHDDDAAGILSMLRRWGWGWHDLDRVFGDRDHNMQYRGGTKKSNIDLHRAVAAQLKVTRLVPPIIQAKTGSGAGAGSVGTGVDWLMRAMVPHRGFGIYETCSRTIESFEKWNGDKNSDYKDIIDAIRYATWEHANSIRQVRPQKNYQPAKVKV